MEIFDIIGKLLAAFAIGLVAYLVPKIKSWLENNVDKAVLEQICTLVDSFVRAADQLYHDDDPTGEKRNAYVREQLERAGVEITETVIGLIEGAVLNVNIEQNSIIIPDAISIPIDIPFEKEEVVEAKELVKESTTAAKKTSKKTTKD